MKDNKAQDVFHKQFQNKQRQWQEIKFISEKRKNYIGSHIIQIDEQCKKSYKGNILN